MKKLFFISLILVVNFSHIEAQTQVYCANCNGTGVIGTCNLCYGTGIRYTMFGPTICLGCGGSGKIYCPLCMGQGYITIYPTTYYNSYPQNYNTTSTTNVTMDDYHTYESSYEYVDFEHCHATGVCQTCNGKGYYNSPFGTGTIKCPNCYGGNQSGKCNWCEGTGKRKKFVTNKVQH